MIAATTASLQVHACMWVQAAEGGEAGEGDEEAAINYLVDALEALGYSSWSYRVVASACTGLANRRKRLFLVASWSADARDVMLSQVLPRHSPATSSATRACSTQIH